MNFLNNIYNKITVLALAVMLTASCSDYFDPSPKDVMDTDEYISDESEVFKGMLGIMSRMQDAGDQSIFLTDTRMNILETTDNAPTALQSIYNYDDTDENEYADPTCYYALVRACNDYISKMGDYHASHYDASDGHMLTSEVTDSCFKPLLASAIRVKVWAYYMLGKTYGEAYWFDDPLDQKYELSNTAIFTHCDMKALTAKCLNLLDNGIDVDGVHIDASLDMKWYKWLNQNTTDRTTYRKWQYLTPPFLLLKAELLSWKCNYETDNEAKSDWTWIRDNLLEYMYKIHNATESTELDAITVNGITYSVPGFEDGISSTSYIGWTYQTNIPLQSDAAGAYYNIFYSEDIGSKWQVISSVIYDYSNNQRNRLVQYFCPEYPGDGFYLKPSEYATKLKESSSDETALYQESDIRSITQKMVMNNIGGQDCISKYYYSYVSTARAYQYLRTNIFEIQPSIVLFRGHDLHFLIAEAENHLGNWDQAQTLLNGGITNRFAERYDDATWQTVCEELGWSKYYGTWFGSAGGYGDAGLAGNAVSTLYSQVTKNDDGTFTLDGKVITEEQRKEYIDWCLAEEHSKEYVAEGKSYAYLCKMAERWSNAGRGGKTAAADEMARIITPKYKSSGKASKVTTSLENKYFINWNLKGM